MVDSTLGVLGEVWSDLHHDIKGDGKGAIKRVINIESVITSIDNILRTAPSERVMLPDFAARLRHMVFERASQESMNSIADEIKDSLAKWDDRVLINSVDFYAHPDRNEIRAELSFMIRGHTNIFQHSVLIPSGG
ncbi:MAG: GPW/gp25 family protein [Candidatus Heimdallarchaeaceae archaeon]